MIGKGGSMKPKIISWAIGVLFCIAFTMSAVPGVAAKQKNMISKEGRECIGCHEAQSPAFVKEWRISAHAVRGLDCYSFHKAEKTDPDSIDHNGFTVSILVTPKDCSRCHPQQVKEKTSSHNAKAGNILDSLDKYLGEE